MIFVSPGRCATKRIAEILRAKLPPEEFSITHQMAFSRLANVAGNLMYHFGQSEKIKEELYYCITSKYIKGTHFITTDPLSAMMIPESWIKSENVCIVQVTRNPEAFAESFYRFSRERIKSFIAHNFVPFWQIGVWPLENSLNKKIKNKYIKIAKQKENWFQTLYATNPNFFKIHMDELFKNGVLENLIKQFFMKSVPISQEELLTKANQTKDI